MSMSKNSGGSAAAAAAATGGGGNNGGYMTYFDYHGIEPGAYYGVPYRQVRKCPHLQNERLNGGLHQVM